MIIFRLIAFFTIVFFFSTKTVLATSFFDNFDDGNADGWWLGYSQHTPWIPGNWRVENGELVNDQAGDGFMALVDSLVGSDQTVQVDFKSIPVAGYGGVTLWHEDYNNWVAVRLYPGADKLWIEQNHNGVYSLIDHNLTLEDSTWYKLAVKADSSTGMLDIFVDDLLMVSETVTTPIRSGRSGVFNGNSGSYFDNFSLNIPGPTPLLIGPPANKEQCKKDGWKTFNNPFFKNLGDCTSYVNKSQGSVFLKVI